MIFCQISGKEIHVINVDLSFSAMAIRRIIFHGINFSAQMFQLKIARKYCEVQKGGGPNLRQTSPSKK